MTCGIYCIENSINEKKYIGQSVNVERRMNMYHYFSQALNRAIEKYGINSFKRYIIVSCEKKELNYYEEACIKIFHSHTTKYGYNINLGGSIPMTYEQHKKAIENGIETKRLSAEKEKELFRKEHTKNKYLIKILKSYGIEKITSGTRFERIRFRVIINNKYIGRCKTAKEAIYKYNDYIIKNNLPNFLISFENLETKHERRKKQHREYVERRKKGIILNPNKQHLKNKCEQLIKTEKPKNSNSRTLRRKFWH